MPVIHAIKISKRKLRTLSRDAEKSATAIHLVYSSDKDEGIHRTRHGRSFVYTIDGRKISDESTLNRIKKLVIPPAWKNVWICRQANGHLQATGFDVKNRKQYKYHSSWSEFRNQTKFYQLQAFGKKLPAIRAQLESDLARPGLPREKVLAAVVTILQETSIRVGNNVYEKLYGSFGLSTLKDQHVAINGSIVKFSFKGKKGIYHEVDLKSRKLARIVKQCRDISGRELFQYYDENGERKAIDSGEINEYIKKICCDNFTTKDFRTWMGSVYAIEALQKLGCCDSEAEAKSRIVQAMDSVAKRLGNTRAVCKKYYVHPAILALYSEKTLENFFNHKEEVGAGTVSPFEKILMKILEAADARQA